MFGRIAGRYDLMNRIMTAGLDGRWRAAAAAEARLAPGDRALDVCCGTGDLAFALARHYPGASITGLDFAEPMLARARQKAARRWATRRRAAPVPNFVAGDLLALPFADETFAVVTVAFGVRNVADLPGAFAEMVRVTRPGGKIVCLEITSPPPGVGRRFHALWFDRLVPALGRLVAGDGSAYTYLPASVRSFPAPDELAAIMRCAGLRDVRYQRFGLGIVALHVGLVPDRSGTPLASLGTPSASPGTPSVQPCAPSCASELRGRS
jgi:demethylmenaquinone methyltransferase/2-methoxy-6-polyprenyl-1,4-benzoquinol methylase